MDNLTRHIEYLQSLISDLNPDLANYGKNKAIRSNESSKISDAADQLERYLGHNKDLASLLLEYHNGNEYGYNETLQYQYVYKDTLRFITFLKEKLNQEAESSEPIDEDEGYGNTRFYDEGEKLDPPIK